MGTHDIIQFPPPPMKMLPRTWLLLGQIQAMITALDRLPLLPEDAYQNNLLYLAKGIHGTTAIEGNQLPEDEVYALLHSESPPAAGDDFQRQQIQNMLAAYTAVTLNTPPPGAPEFSLIY